jgi:hypothetical protein
MNELRYNQGLSAYSAAYSSSSAASEAGMRFGSYPNAVPDNSDYWLVDQGFVDPNLVNPPAFLDLQVQGYEVPFSVLATIGWIVSTVFLIGPIFIRYSDYSTNGSTWSSAANAAYVALVPLAFVIGLAVLLLMCVLGQGGLIGMFLSSFFWRPLSRLSYSTFLVHPVIIFGAYSSAGSLFYFRDLEMMYLFTTNVILATSLAFIIYALVERPFRALSKGEFKQLS